MNTPLNPCFALPVEIQNHGPAIRYTIHDANGEAVCSLHHGDPSGRESAEFVKRAINCHQELVTALHVAADLIKIARIHFPRSIKNSDKFTLECTCAAISTALYKAEGQS